MRYYREISEYKWFPKKPLFRKYCRECDELIHSRQNAYQAIHYDHTWSESIKIHLWICENCHMLEML